MAVTFVLAFGGSVLAQEQWVEFSSPRDGFRITFPGTPGIEDVTWTSQMGYALPARVFTVDRGREHYSVTVADYRGIEKLGIAKSQSCAPGAETCIGGQTRIVGPGYWKSDVHGAITYAVFMLLRRHGTPTGMTWNWAEQVEGTLLQFTNADQSRTSASIYMHDNRLYVIEGDVPKGTPEPELFKMSIGFIRPDGSGSNIYSHRFRISAACAAATLSASDRAPASRRPPGRVSGARTFPASPITFRSMARLPTAARFSRTTGRCQSCGGAGSSR
ncbi:MAG: hypothetical protein DMF88_24050 [Acidobacteria bacterium]|nr:MAG: hypothetical protein DMF88_24050 [Acidobacteriota bacterium]